MRFLILLLFSINFIASEVNEIYMNHDGHLRSYLKYIPESVNIEKPTDIFIGIHGYTGTASGFQKETTGGFNKSADKYNFITINTPIILPKKMIKSISRWKRIMFVAIRTSV